MIPIKKRKNDHRIQAMFKRSGHIKISILIIGQDSFRLQKKTTTAKGTTYHIFKQNNFTDIEKLFQDKASMDMTLTEFKVFTSACWNRK